MKFNIKITNNIVWFFIILLGLYFLDKLFGLAVIVIPFIAWELTR
jgi:hypothetical protein